MSVSTETETLFTAFMPYQRYEENWEFTPSPEFFTDVLDSSEDLVDEGDGTPISSFSYIIYTCLIFSSLNLMKVKRWNWKIEWIQESAAHDRRHV